MPVPLLFTSLKRVPKPESILNSTCASIEAAPNKMQHAKILFTKKLIFFIVIVFNRFSFSEAESNPLATIIKEKVFRNSEFLKNLNYKKLIIRRVFKALKIVEYYSKYSKN